SHVRPHDRAERGADASDASAGVPRGQQSRKQRETEIARRDLSRETFRLGFLVAHEAAAGHVRRLRIAADLIAGQREMERWKLVADFDRIKRAARGHGQEENHRWTRMTTEEPRGRAPWRELF